MAGQKEESNTKDKLPQILIADDDLPTRILLRSAIAQWGYEVIEAEDGEQAWKILKQPSPPQLMVLDWLMPKLDGVELCARIKRELNYNLYIILLTEVTGTSNIIKALEAGADEFLTKPFNIAELRTRLSVGTRIINYKTILAAQNKQLQTSIIQREAMAESLSSDQLQKAIISLISNASEFLKQQKKGELQFRISFNEDKDGLQLALTCMGSAPLMHQLETALRANDNKQKSSVELSQDIFQKMGGTLALKTTKDGSLLFMATLPSTEGE